MNFKESAKIMQNYLEKFYPLQRMFNSPGIDQTFKTLKEDIEDIKIHEYKAGLTCEDWTVPYNWEMLYGVMKDENGNIIVSSNDNILFVSAFSESVSGWFSKNEIQKHCLIHPRLNDVFMFQHRLAFNFDKKDWGISMPRNIFDHLDNSKKYFIDIKVKKKNTPMKVAEWFIQGKSNNIICIAAHIDEQLCNDDLTGCVVGLELMKYINKLKNRKYSYQLLLFPETIGSFIYMYHNEQKIKQINCMLNLEMLGAGETLSLKHSMDKTSYFDMILKLSIQQETNEYKELDFFEGYENDERSFAWPTFGITGVGIQRHPFKYYHTHKDNPDIIKSEYLIEGLKISKNFIDILESDYIPIFTYKIPPKLSKHNLYYDSIEDPLKFQKFNNHLLFNINGKNKISDLAEKIGLSYWEVYDYLENFVNLNLIKRI